MAAKLVADGGFNNLQPKAVAGTVRGYIAAAIIGYEYGIDQLARNERYLYLSAFPVRKSVLKRVCNQFICHQRNSRGDLRADNHTVTLNDDGDTFAAGDKGT